MPYKDPVKQKEYQSKHYQENKDAYYSSSKNSKRKALQTLVDLKKNPCVDCGMTFHPCIMEFDHTRGEKLGNVAWLARSKGIKVALEEIEKCDLVCANCHNIRTYKRQVGIDISEPLPDI